MPLAIARSTPSRSPRVQASEICRCSAELAPNSKRNWKKPNPQANRYAPDPSLPIASSTSRIVHSENTTWSGTRSASQNVPLSRRPRTGGRFVLVGPDMAMVAGLAVLTESFLGGVTPFAPRVLERLS